MDTDSHGGLKPHHTATTDDLEVKAVTERKSIDPERMSGALLRFWPILTAALILAASVGGGWVRLSTVEARLAIHERYFRSVAVNQYLMCRVLNKSVVDKDERLKCEYPEE